MQKLLKPILYFDTDNLAGAVKCSKEWDKIKDTTEIVSLEYDLDEFKKYLPCTSIPQIGDTFLLDPFHRDSYVDIKNFDDFILKQKFSCISDIALLLGAESFKYRIEVTECSKRSIEANGELKTIKFDANASVSIEHSKKLNSSYSDSQTYDSPGIPSSEDYCKAVEKAKEFSLYYEPDVRELLNKRNPDQSNHLKTRHVVFSLSKEINMSKDMAFNLNYMRVLKGKGSYKEHTELRYEVICSMDICF